MQVTSVLTFTTLVDLWRLQPRYILQTKNANIVLCTASAISPISSPKVTWLKFKSSPRGALKREKKAAFIGMSVYTYMHSPPTHARTHTMHAHAGKPVTNVWGYYSNQRRISWISSFLIPSAHAYLTPSPTVYFTSCTQQGIPRWFHFQSTQVEMPCRGPNTFWHFSRARNCRMLWWARRTHWEDWLVARLPTVMHAAREMDYM